VLTIYHKCAKSIAVFLSLLFIGCAGSANAQVTAPPTKEIVIYNDSATETIYPMLQAPVQSNPKNPDIWLQGYFMVTNTTTQTFNNSKVYEVFFNKDHGIAPNHSISITVPFFTQLKQPGSGGVGATTDEYIDWWNAMRLVLFDSHTAVTGAYEYYENGTPPVVAPLAGATSPTCAKCQDPVNITEYIVNPPFNIPFQLVEYTFANYGGSPPKLQATQKSPPYANEYRVGYDVSSIDSEYLPVAIAPLHNDIYGYLGTGMTVKQFRLLFNQFIKDNKWPTYFPAYFPAGAPPAPYSTTPPSGAYPDGAYPGTVAVGPFNVFTETYRTDANGARFIPSPPLVTSNLPDTASVMPGTAVSNMIKLWTQCSAPDPASTCAAITIVKTALDDAGCPNPLYNPGMIPATQLDLVYGWVNNGCASDFRPSIPPTPAQQKTFEDYLKLQYNYCGDVPSPEPDCLPAHVPAQSLFNPWTQLIHKTLRSNAYAFSVDDSVGFVLLDGDGLIISVGGTANLPCPHQLTPGPLQPNGTRLPPQPTCPSHTLRGAISPLR
jgi:hypothetical protein